jgi:toxin ParE1/3/4
LAVIVSYVAQDNRKSAESLGRAILERTRMLADFPRAGRILPEERDPNVREIIVEPYRVIYELNRNGLSVEVLRVWHAARGKPEI